MSFENQIAVIGIAGRFPGAESPAQFWENLRNGRCAVSDFNRNQLLEAGHAPDLIDNPVYVPAKGVLEQPLRFDAELFGYTPMEARLLDPQQRVFLEQSLAAMEDAGYGASCDCPVGVFAGAGANTYLLEHVLPSLQQDADTDGFQAYLGAQNDFLATRVAYKLNLHGPAMTVQTACSTSLTALHLARESLLAYECDMALAGGACISFPTHNGYLHSEGGILSGDGRCRTFDAEADGTVTGNGVGVVLLKRLEDALEDRDPIHAVLLGSAVNNDGDRKVGFTAPSVNGQAEAVARALVASDLEPGDVDIMECHGTATPLGDPIEIEALRMVYGNQPLKLGAVKANIGHLDAAAGIAGVIKTILSLKNHMLPPVWGFQNPNPNLDLGSFQITDQPTPLPERQTPYRAGVSSFGIGGTNAHAILETAPAQQPGSPSRPHHTWIWSAATTQSLDQLTQDLTRHMTQFQPNAADTAFTLQKGRRTHSQRACIAAAAPADALAALRGDRMFRGAPIPGLKTTFLFNGMGSVFPGATQQLYRAEPLYKQHLDACCLLFSRHMNLDLREPLFSSDPEMKNLLYRTDVQMALVFAVGYAMARFWMELGVQPTMLAGVSAGEYTAACVAGVLPLGQMVELIAIRAKLTQALPQGAMLNVGLSPDDVAKLDPLIQIGSINLPDACVVTGSETQIDDFAERLNQLGHSCGRPRVQHAFHSHMLDPMLAEFSQQAAKFQPQLPQIPCFSSLTGDWLTLEDLTDANYWSNQIRRPARFELAFDKLLGDPKNLLLEVGPTHGLRPIGGRHPKYSEDQSFLTSMPHPDSGRSQTAHQAETLGRLWIAGCDIQWSQLYKNETRNRVHLPGYAFGGQDYCLTQSRNAKPKSQGKTADPTQWFHIPYLQPTASRPPVNKLAKSRILVRGDGPFTTELMTILGSAGAVVENLSAEREGVTAWAETLDQVKPQIILHCALYGTDPTPPDCRHLGYRDLLDLAAALETVQVPHITLYLIADGLLDPGPNPVRAAKAAALGPLIALAQERVELTTHAVDLDAPSHHAAGQLILNELAQPTESDRIQLRLGRRKRWEYQPIQPPRSSGGRMRKRGLYLITGGLGDLGLNIAQMLAPHQPTLVLLGRSPYPSRNAAQPQDDPRWERIQQIEAAGARVLCLSCDITQKNQLQETLEQVQTKHGPIHGLFHAAGVIGGDQFNRPAHLIDVEMTAAQFQAKVMGMNHLSQLLPDLDFRIAISSIATALGGPGSAAYAAANHQINALAESGRPCLWTAVSLDMLDGSRISVADRAALQYLISAEEIRDVMARVVDLWPTPNLLVAAGDLQARLARWTGRNIPEFSNQAEQQAGPKDLTPTQARVAQVWRRRLGLDKVGLDDNYFDLGGDSFIAVQLLAALKRQFNRDLPVSLLMDAPTVRQTAALIDNQQPSESDTTLTRMALGDPGAEPLFLIHPAGGSVYFYRELVAQLDTHRPVYGIQAMGLEPNQAPHQSITAMADCYLSQIRRIQPQGPYYLLGASLGGIIAQHMAVQLSAEGTPLALLAMVDTAGPGLLPQSLEDETDILLYLASDIGMDSPEFQKQFRRMPLEEQRTLVLNHFFKDPDTQQSEAALRFFAVFRENMRAMAAHKPAHYAGVVTFFQAQSHREAYDAPNPSQFWLACSDRVDVFRVPGNHITMNRQPHVAVMAKKLSELLKA